MNRIDLEQKYDVRIEVDDKIGRSYFYTITLPDGSILESNVKGMTRVEYLCNKHFKGVK